MRRMAGNLLIALSTVSMAATLLWVGLEITHPPRGLNEDQHHTIVAGVLLAGVLLTLEGVVFATGRHLRHPRPARAAEGMTKQGRRHLPALAVYLIGSVSVATLAALLVIRGSQNLRSLWFLVGQPSILIQLVLGGILGFTDPTEAARSMIIAMANLFYFVVFFYPVYGMVTIDQTVETVRYQRMKTLLVLFCAVHLLLGLVFAILLRA